MSFDNITLWFAKNEKGNIITINEINDNNKNNKYYCPMCNSDLIPKAIKSKQITEHFAHIDASKCNNETMIHWWFKNKFLENGDKFTIISDKERQYICKEVLTEQIYNVDNKTYKPDVAVITECGKIIYFEMDYSNKKKVQDYIDIWLELKNIVVEVDIKKLMNKDKIPTFKALFYDGKCFNTKKNDTYYNLIGIYKEKRYAGNLDDKQKENIKKLDWFWNDVVRYKNNEITIEYMADLINSIDEDEKLIVRSILEKPRCNQLYSDYKKYEKKQYLNEFTKLSKEIDLKFNNRIKIHIDISNSGKYEYKHLSIQSNLRENNNWKNIGSSSGGSCSRQSLIHDIEYIENQIKYELDDIKKYNNFRQTLDNQVLLEVVNKINDEMKIVHNNYSFELSEHTYSPDKVYYCGRLPKYEIIFELKFNSGKYFNNILEIDITNEYFIRNSQKYDEIYDYFINKINDYRNKIIPLDIRILPILNEASIFLNKEYNISCWVSYSAENKIKLIFDDYDDRYCFDVSILNNILNNIDISNCSINEIKHILSKIIINKIKLYCSNNICKDCNDYFKLKIQEILYYKKLNLDLPKRCPECRKAKKQLKLRRT